MFYIKDYTTAKIIGPFKTELQVCHYLNKHPEIYMEKLLKKKYEDIFGNT